MTHSIAVLFGTRRGILLLLRNALVAFGVLTGMFQIGLALWPEARPSGENRWSALLMLVTAALLFGLLRAWPGRKVSRTFSRPDIKIRVEIGDLFDQESHLIVGFSDTFDTDTTNGVVISESSVQGQFQKRIYGQDLARLDTELASALVGRTIESTETRADKSTGKLDRYPIGTVAVLGDPTRHFFCVAYSKMQNNLIASSNVDFLWQSLGAAWEGIYLRGQQKPVSIPVVGSELARVSCLDRESLLKMILLSFVARSRQSLVSKELRVIIHPKDHHHINMLEVEAFLRTL
ncbi:macro domain-containing protein [Streptomyces olivoreticuli]